MYSLWNNRSKWQVIYFKENSYLNLSLLSKINIFQFHQVVIYHLLISRGSSTQQILLSRANILQGVLPIYSSHVILNVLFENEPAHDVTGVTKDMFSSVWKTLREKFMTGENLSRISLAHGNICGETDYKSMGKTLEHGLSLVGYAPVFLNPAQFYFLPTGWFSSSKRDAFETLFGMPIRVRFVHLEMCSWDGYLGPGIQSEVDGSTFLLPNQRTPSTSWIWCLFEKDCKVWTYNEAILCPLSFENKVLAYWRTTFPSEARKAT